MDSETIETRGTTIDIEQIQRMIPHRYPMLMVDRIIDLVPNQRATGIKSVSINEPYFQGHFPGAPVMPGVLIIEAMAQTAAVLVVATLGAERDGSLVYFMSIDSARFRKPVTPGDVLHVHVERGHNRRNVWKFEGKATVDGEVVAQATYAAMIRDEKMSDSN